MYFEHFGLKEAPFRITPHPDFFFDGADRGTTLEALMYAILHDEGIVKVSGEIGSGKTMLCRVLMERLPPEVETVFLANPSYSRAEIVHAIADELELQFSAGPATPALRELQLCLIGIYASGRRVVVLIDEAHAMPEETMEQVRLLSNLESSRHKLLQMVLFGQPELDEALAKPAMRQLKDRITHSFRMRPLTQDEVGRYISFRLHTAGYRGPDLFSAAAVAAIARASDGLTRRINILADKSLLAAFAENTHAITPRHVRAAVADSDFAPLGRRAPRWVYASAGATLLAAGVLAGAGLYALLEQREPEPRAAAPQALAAAPQPAAAAPAPPAAPVPPRPAAPVAPGPAASPQADSAAQAAPGAANPVPPASAAAPDRAGGGEAAAPPAASEPAPEKPAAPLLAREQLRRLSGYAPGGNRLLRERIAAARERLQGEPDESFSIELFTTENSDAARMERFLMRARDMVPLSDVYVVPIAAGARYRILVLYGTFAERAAASEAARRLPPKYQRAFQTELRTFAEVRALL